MLNIIRELEPFFLDLNKEINVREYSRLKKVSPPTASKLLDYYYKEGLLKKELFRNFIFYSANPDNPNFKDLKRIYLRK